MIHIEREILALWRVDKVAVGVCLVFCLRIIRLRTDYCCENRNINMSSASNFDIISKLYHDVVQLYVLDGHTLNEVKGLVEKQEPNVNMT